MKLALRIIVAVVSPLMLTALAKAQSVDAIYHNGAILTMAGSTPNYAEAIAIKDGKIAFVGDKAEAFKLKSDATRLLDLGGKTLLPGFLDAHSHYINSLLVANQCKY